MVLSLLNDETKRRIGSPVRIYTFPLVYGEPDTKPVQYDNILLIRWPAPSTFFDDQPINGLRVLYGTTHLSLAP